MKKKIILPLIVIAIVIAIVANTDKSVSYQKCQGMVFGTTYSIIYESNENLQAVIEKELKDVDASLSMFNKESLISQINNNEADTLDKHLGYVFNIASEVYDASNGDFDITVAPLVNAWGFGFKNGEMPDEKTTDSIRQFVGMNLIEVKEGRVSKKDERVMIDCGAIAKGYGVDAVANVLRSKGVKNFMVEIGGEIVNQGLSSSGKEWRIGVVKPDDDSLNTSTELQTMLQVSNIAMATSGNYRNFYHKNGKKYAHTIDPKTGKPVQHNILSATVFAENCTKADAYATAFMVSGLEKAQVILKEHPEIKAYIIYSDNQGKNAIWYSKELQRCIIE